MPPYNFLFMAKGSFSAWGFGGATVLAAAVWLPGCTTARIDQFERFAEAGVAYADAIDALTLEAAHAAIDADSAALTRAREALSQQQRREAILEHNDLLKQRVALLGDLQRHADLLRDYFLVLGAMAGSDAPAALSAAAEQVVLSLEVVSGRIREARVGDLPVSDFSGAVVRISVARFQRAALERELRVRAAVLERELDLQQAALSAIAAEMSTDLQAVLGQQELVEVIDPYRAAGGKLPRTWTRRRREILTATAAVESAAAAADAAASLKQTFTRLAENRFSLSDFRALMADVDEILTLLERVRGLDPGE
ncbi:MAG: hypothetical protein ACYSUA_18490 [Planctomycetota bacterium]|jgi:hypothetical protein